MPFSATPGIIYYTYRYIDIDITPPKPEGTGCNFALFVILTFVKHMPKIKLKCGSGFFLNNVACFRTHAHTQTSYINSQLLFLQFVAYRHSNLESELIMLLPSLNLGVLNLWIESEWAHSTCVSRRNSRRSRGENVMSRQRFLRCRWHHPTSTGSRSTSPLTNPLSIMWFKPPETVEPHRTEFWKCFIFFCKIAPGSESLSKPNQPKRSIVRLFPFLLLSVLPPSALVSPFKTLTHLRLWLWELWILGWQIFLLCKDRCRDFLHWWWLILSCCDWGR